MHDAMTVPHIFVPVPIIGVPRSVHKVSLTLAGVVLPLAAIHRTGIPGPRAIAPTLSFTPFSVIDVPTFEVILALAIDLSFGKFPLV